MTYAPVNGLQLYYETRGTGRPLVLLDGGLLTIDLNFGPLLDPLAASRRVIAVELQGPLTARPKITPAAEKVAIVRVLTLSREARCWLISSRTRW